LVQLTKLHRCTFQPATLIREHHQEATGHNSNFEPNSLWGGAAMSNGTRPTGALGCATGADGVGLPELRPFRLCPSPRFVLSL